MARYGLIGEKLGHSYSKEIHETLGYGYDLWEVAPEELGAFMERADFEGINVTIPYKKEVMRYLDEVSDTAERLGAVNTVYKKSGRLIGTNTDYAGLKYTAKRAGIDLKGKNVLVLGGTGGAGGMARVLAEDEGAARVDIASRRSGPGTVSYDDLPRDTQIVINATPAGMYPDTDAVPADISVFDALEGLIDIIYNPLRTSLRQQAEKAGARTAGGLPMLVRQATEAAGYFRGGDFSGETEKILRRLEKEMENIVLIGMPGCGKSSIAKKAARRLGRDVKDIDREITARYGRTPAEIIERDGEEAFRDIESLVIADIAKEKSLVIATGGGAVKRSENIDALKRNGRVFLIDREMSKLSTKGRPLSRGDGLKKLYRERMPLYRAAADVTVKNDGESFAPAAQKIIKEYE